MNCTNCQERSHSFRECGMPIVSHGILGFKVVKGKRLFLLVRRKDTMGYIDFLRGKYAEDGSSLKTLIEEMTIDEHVKLKTLDFDVLWDDLWVNHSSRPYLNEKRSAKIKFSRLDKELLLSGVESRWESAEYCIPKGRKNFNESSIDCSKREFIEETGFKETDFKVIDETLVLDENFYASNGVNYSHRYMLAEILSDSPPRLDYSSHLMIGEIDKIKYFTFEESINIFRKYDTGKRNALYLAKRHLDFYLKN